MRIQIIVRRLMAAVAALGLAAIAQASITGTNFANITSTATTIDWTPPDPSTQPPPTTVCVANGPKADQSASANEVYVMVYSCGEVIAAATTSSPIVIQPGEGWLCMTHTKDSELGQGYCGLSAITASTETATLRYFRK